MLSHRCIIGLLDLLTPPDMNHFDDLFIVFEFVDTDLERLIKSKQYFENIHVQYMMYQVLLSLRYCHTSHILHRDIKPGSLTLSKTFLSSQILLCELKMFSILFLRW